MNKKQLMVIRILLLVAGMISSSDINEGNKIIYSYQIHELNKSIMEELK